MSLSETLDKISQSLNGEKTVEEQPIKTKSEDMPRDTLSRVARQEKHMTEMRKQLEESKKQLESEKEELKKYRQADQYLQSDPMSAFSRIGFTPDKLKQLLNDLEDPKTAMNRKTMQAIEEIRKEIQEKETQRANEELTRSEKRLMHRISEEIKDNDYDIIDEFEARDSVKDYMEAYYEATGEIPKVSEACEAVAEALAEKVKRSSQSKYYSKKSGQPIITEVEEEVEKKSMDPVRKVKISPRVTVKDTGGMSDYERQQEAMKLLRTMSQKK